MQEIFDKIKERLEEIKKLAFEKYEKATDTDEIITYGNIVNAYGYAIAIVNQVAEEYKSLTIEEKGLTEKFNDGWIPVSSGKMPDNGRRCWVTYEWADGSLHVDKDYFVDGKWFETENEAVKAWMYNDEEKPKPYQPKGE